MSGKPLKRFYDKTMYKYQGMDGWYRVSRGGTLRRGQFVSLTKAQEAGKGACDEPLDPA